MSFSAPPDDGGQWQSPRPEIDFSVISESFSILFANWKVYAIPGLLILLLSIPANVTSLMAKFSPDSLFGRMDQMTLLVLQFGMGLGATIIGVLFYAGIVQYTWKLMRGLGATSDDLWTGFKDPLGYIGLSILVSLIAGVGVLACCVGTFFFAGLTMFALPIKVATGVTTSEAISQSWNMLKKDWFLAGLLYLVVIVVSFVGMFACYVGYFLTSSLLYIVPTVLYSRYVGMSARPESAAPTSYPRGG